MSSDDHGRSRATGLFRLVRDAVALRSRPRTDVGGEEAHRWLAGLPAGPSCRVNALRPRRPAGHDAAEEDETIAAAFGGRGGGPPAWAELDKLAAPPCPTPPAVLEAWLDPAWPFDPDEPPTLREQPREDGDGRGADDADDAAAEDPTAPRDRRPAVTGAADVADAADAADGADGARRVDESGGAGDAEPADDGPPADSTAAGDDTGAAADPESGPPAAVVEAHARFVRESWEPWSRGHAAWRAHDEAYTALFAMRQAVTAREEDLELVVGLGLLAWDVPGGEPVRRHLIAVPATFDFDEETGRIAVVPADDPPVGETDMLPPTERPEGWEARVTEAAAALEEPPHEPEALDRLLAAAANELGGGRGTWSATTDPPEAPTDRPRVTLSPAIVLRRRGRGLLVERVGRIVEALESGTTPPAVVRRITGEDAAGPTGPDGVDGPRGAADDGGAAGGADQPGAVGIGDPSEAADDAARSSRVVAPDDRGPDAAPRTDELAGAAPGRADAAGVPDAAPEVLLPLPANDEQRAIVRRLSRSPGVLVQGPPGTGKSHTIANLMCHLLATGRRVLVTAQSPRALAVVRDKLPEELRPLCIALLGNDGRALQQLESSVATIVERCEEDPAIDRRRAEEAASRLERLRSELAALDGEILERRRVRGTPTAIEGTGYRGTPDAIARQVAAEGDRHAWLEVAVIDPDAALPEEAARLPELLAALRSIDPARRAELDGAVLPDPADLPEASRVRDLVEAESTVAARLDVLAATSPEGPDPEDLEAAEVEGLEAALSALLRTMGDVDAAARGAGWLGRAADEVLAGDGERWTERLEVARGHAEEIEAAIGPVEDRELSIPDSIDRARLRADAEDLLARLERGGSVGLLARLVVPSVRRARYVMDEVRVDGRACDRPETLRPLLESLEVEARMRRLDAYVSDLVRTGTGPLRLRFASLRRCLDDLERLARLDRDLATAREAVHAAAAEWLGEPDWTSRDAVEGWRAAAARRQGEADVAVARAEVDEAAAAIEDVAARAGAHAVCGRLAAAVRERDLGAFARARGELEALHADVDRLAAVRDEIAGMPAALEPLARAIAGDPEAAHWDERLAALPAAWDHARARAWLERLDSGPDLGELNRRARRLQEAIERETTELVAARAWTAARERLDDAARQHLQSWMIATRNLGKGTGRYAAARRRKARGLLERCREAVPGWIMPLYRVAEQVEPTPGAFDVVIVDEASQCGIEAVGLAWIASRLVVVGDDEQISPTVIIEREPLYRLASKHLDRDPVAAVLEPDTSLFDLGRVWFDDPVRLREHFRCMPEIIGFSDRLAYDGRLVPLRQAPPDRLEPVRTVHVPEGVRVERGGDVTNPPEAAAMVELVAACHEDPAYDGRTFGVVSLLGEAQAKLVEDGLARRIGPEAMAARRLVCGDAYGFQGDERDVMFLGLVAAPVHADGTPVRAMPLVRRDARQRFNVAMSRGCDQVWLVHSVTLENLANPDDLRRRILEYCLEPAGPVPVEVPDLDELAARTAGLDRDRDPAPTPFASWLALDVHRALRARGYDVLPAFEVAGGRLDLVVTDGRRLVAVACEGEARRDREELASLLARRRRLERAGWRYLDVSGTRFHLDPERALNELWTGLEQAGVRPVAGAPGASGSSGAAVG